MRILILGAYGLIGSHVTRRLREAGHNVTGLGRHVTRAARRFPDVNWITADLANLLAPAAWKPVLADCEPAVIVNCAGVLQDGPGDSVAAVQSVAMKALFEAADAQGGIQKFIQISAPGAHANAKTTFMRTKADADEALKQSGLDWTILRPGLVLAPEAYGGSALLRGFAALPLVQPLVHTDALFQTVSVDDVAKAVREVIEGKVASRQVYDLVEPEPHRLEEIVTKMRSWLGFPPAHVVEMPQVFAALSAWLADVAGWLGWRSPLRSTALAEVAAGVTGDPTGWTSETGKPLKSLDDTLSSLPATAQERWFARAYFLKPLVIVSLAGFWIATGLIALFAITTAIEILAQRGVPDSLATGIVVGGGIADLAVGLGILVRKTARVAAFGMIALTIAYLLGGTLIAPDLWLDPLGAFIKPIPAAILAAVAAAMMEER